MDSRSVGLDTQYNLVRDRWNYLVSLPEEELSGVLSAENQAMCTSVIQYLSDKVEESNKTHQLVQEASKIVRCLPEKYSENPQVLKVIGHISRHGGFATAKSWLGATVGSIFGYCTYTPNPQLVEKIRMSIRDGHGDMALVLLDSEFPLSDALKKEFLFLACEKGEVKVVEKLMGLLTKVGFATHEESYLTASGEEIMGQPLVVDLDFTGGDFDETPLHVACRCGHADIALMLIKKGADVNMADSYGETPIFNAFDQGLEVVVNALIKAHAGLHESNLADESLFQLVAERLLSGESEENGTSSMDRNLLLFFIEGGADTKPIMTGDKLKELIGDALSERIMDGATSSAIALLNNEYPPDPQHLFLAFSNGDAVVAEKLVKMCGKDCVDWQDDKGNTLLHSACKNNLGDIAMVLIKNGASLHTPNKKGDTPLQEAIRNETAEVIDYLEFQGVDISAVRWETELKCIAELSGGLAKRIAKELGTKPKNSSEAQVIFKLTKQIDDIRKKNSQLPPSLQLSEKQLIALLEGQVLSAGGGSFFISLDQNISSVLAKLFSEQFMKLPLLAQEAGGVQFGNDFAKFYFNPGSKENALFVDGKATLFDHPFFLADKGEKIRMVLQAKARALGIGDEEFDSIFLKTESLFHQSGLSVQELYASLERVLILCAKLHDAQSFVDKSSMWFRSLVSEKDGTDVYRKVANHVIKTLGPVLVHHCSKISADSWVEPLSKLMTIAGGMNADDIEFDHRVIGEVLIRIASEHGFPEDVEKFSKLVDDPSTKGYLLELCKIAAGGEKFREENIELWKERFAERCIAIPSMPLFGQAFEPFFHGAVDRGVLETLVKAAFKYDALAGTMNVPPDVFAQALALYYENLHDIKAVPDPEALIAYCDTMPESSNWKGRLMELCGQNIQPDSMRLFTSDLLKNNIYPRSKEEEKIIASMFMKGVGMLYEGGYSTEPEAMRQVGQGCIQQILFQRKQREPLHLPQDAQLLSSFQSSLPVLDGWNALLIEQDLGQKLLKEMSIHQVRGPVSQMEMKAISVYPNQMKLLILKGYPENVAAIAITRYMADRFKRGLELEIPIPEKTMITFCFEACVESALNGEKREKIEEVVLLFSCMQGKEIVLGKDGQRRLAFLSRKVASPSFAKGRSPSQFRVIEKFPQILRGIGIGHVKNINHLVFDEKLLGDLFDGQVNYVFKNLNLRELLLAIMKDPNQAIASLLIPAITILTGDASEEMQGNIKKIIPLVTSSDEFKLKLAEFNELLSKADMLNSVEFDIDVSTPDIIAGLLEGILGMKAEEFKSSSVFDESKKQEPPLVRQLFRKMGDLIFDKDKSEGAGMGATGKRIVQFALKSAGSLQSPLTTMLGSSLAKSTAVAMTSAYGTIGDFKSYIWQDPDYKVDPLLLNVMPAMIDIVQKTVVNLLKRVPLNEQQELIAFWLQMSTEEALDETLNSRGASGAERTMVKKIAKDEILMKLYESAERILKHCHHTLPGLFEGVLAGVKSVPQSSLLDVSKIVAPPVVLEPADQIQDTEALPLRQKGFSEFMMKEFKGSFYTSDSDKFIIANVIPLVTDQMRGILQQRSLTGQELSEIKKLIEIGYKLVEEYGYSAEEVAIACRLYCEEQVKEGKSIKAPVYLMMIEDKEKQQLLPFAFDAAVEICSRGILSGSTRQGENGATEEYLKEKILFYVNHSTIKGCTTPLTPNGKKALFALIQSMLDPQFCSGKNLLDPLVIERFSLILKGSLLSHVHLINQANPSDILGCMVKESAVCLKKINIGTLLKVVRNNPKEFLIALSNPVLESLMGNISSDEELQTKKIARTLLTTFDETNASKDLVNKIEMQLGKFDLKGVGIDLSVSLPQLIGALRKETALLSRDLEKGIIPKVKVAERYGMVAPLLVKLTAHIDAVQRERKKPLDARDTELAGSPLMSLLEELKPFAGFISAERGVEEEKGTLGQIKKGLVSSITETAKSIATGESITKWIVRKVVEDKIASNINTLQRESRERPLTPEEGDQLKFYMLLSTNMQPVIEAVSNVAVKALSHHDLSHHTGLVGYLSALSEDPSRPVDEKKLLEHLLVSVDALFNEIDVYKELIPGILAALSSVQKLAV